MLTKEDQDFVNAKVDEFRKNTKIDGAALSVFSQEIYQVGINEGMDRQRKQDEEDRKLVGPFGREG